MRIQARKELCPTAFRAQSGPGTALVKASPCAALGIIITLRLSLTDLFRIASGVVGARLLLTRRENPFFRTAKPLMRVHAFQQELSRADRNLRPGLRGDLQRCKLLDQSLNLLQ